MPEPLYVGETKKGRAISDPAFETQALHLNLPQPYGPIEKK